MRAEYTHGSATAPRLAPTRAYTQPAAYACVRTWIQFQPIISADRRNTGHRSWNTINQLLKLLCTKCKNNTYITIFI